jgi:hypothetical protein
MELHKEVDELLAVELPAEYRQPLAVLTMQADECLPRSMPTSVTEPTVTSTAYKNTPATNVTGVLGANTRRGCPSQ